MKDNLNSRENSVMMNFNTRDVRDIHILNMLQPKQRHRKTYKPSQEQQLEPAKRFQSLYASPSEAPMGQLNRFYVPERIRGDGVDVASQIQEPSRTFGKVREDFQAVVPPAKGKEFVGEDTAAIANVLREEKEAHARKMESQRNVERFRQERQQLLSEMEPVKEDFPEGEPIGDEGLFSAEVTATPLTEVQVLESAEPTIKKLEQTISFRTRRAGLRNADELTEEERQEIRDLIVKNESSGARGITALKKELTERLYLKPKAVEDIVLRERAAYYEGRLKPQPKLERKPLIEVKEEDVEQEQ